ncbi:MAG TPA: hypothetical protein VN374_01290, partial [Desulfitobacteriaceae bacterium]|nr:hypothetical protein [Desulfitobacteriaceae bacterium]
MAKSPSHKFGQIIGNLLEDIIYPFLNEFAKRNGCYVDKAGNRGGARSGKKVTWTDRYGNSHDLDFVLEKDGTGDKQGRPLAFIEAAWRRYTKHSKNKAQEIQGAILPIAENYAWDAPFLGAVIAGEFTSASIKQMESVGFTVLYFSYQSILSSFNEVGIDVSFDESTPDERFDECVKSLEDLSEEKWDRIKASLVSINEEEIKTFMGKLSVALERKIEKILVVPLFGKSYEFLSIADAKHFLCSDFDASVEKGFKKIEVVVVYSNGDKVDGVFHTVEKADEFLNYACK